VRGLADRSAERVERFRWGTSLLTPSLPHVWDLNLLRVERAPLAAPARRLAAEAERRQGHAELAHRKVTVDDETLAVRLAAGFAALGWTIQPLVAMVHRRDPDRPAAGHHFAVEVDADAVRAFQARFLRSLASSGEEGTVRQLLDEGARTAGATRMRHLAVLDGEEVVSACRLYADGRTAQVEDVGTLAEHRGSGLARATVLAAVDLARSEGHELVFLLTHEGDWPRHLYRRLGFEPVGRFYDFVRPVAGSGGRR